EIPGQKVQAVVLIALDLSQSMLAKDIQPSRLERAKFKIADFLDANPRARAGLIGYAGTAHPVLPFTSDYKIIKHHAASLVNREMPVQGTNYTILVDLIDTLMSPVEAPSTVFIMTDALDADAASQLTDWVRNSKHHIEVLLFSSPNGATVPAHPKVHSMQDAAVLRNLSQNEKITVTPLTLDKSDVESISKRINDKLVFQTENKKNDNEWDDMGWLLIFPALLIVLFGFRKGWAVQWSWMLLSLFLTSCGMESKHPDWWYSKNYQGQLLENAGKYEDAADHFETDSYKAVAYYKAGNYQAAADLFELDTTASGQYNKGLALAKLGRYDDALDAFNNAIDLDPAMAAAVKKSINKTQDVKKRSDSIARYNGTSVRTDIKKLKEKEHKDDPLKTRKPKPSDQQLSADTRVKDMPKFGNRMTDESNSNIHSGKEAKSPPKEFGKEQADKMANDILLRRTEADPGEFLHRRFLLQKRRYYPNVKGGSESW
ncbi:MAG TPA: VWA domain-containing protein, partial [Cytophaga sp.]|nr:VWA domain-containing protein [Cytophaga sp.]